MKRLVVLCSFLILAKLAFGQTYGKISGIVTDSSGAVIVGAAVSVVNPLTNFTRSATTNAAGDYNFPDLPPGTYNVRVQMQGFQSEIRNSVELQVDQSARLDFRLNLGAVSETVEVQGGAPLINTENATVGTVIEQKRIEDLPLNGRNFISLIALNPNVTAGNVATNSFSAIRGGTDRGLTSISVAGLRREYNYYSLDGVSNTDVDFNSYAFLPSVDAIQEFKVQTGIYSAEFGRQAAQVNISTRSGTNDYHGTLFEFIRNNDLDARPYAFTTKVPQSAPFKWNQYGFTLGGPLSIPKMFNAKNRLFFMSNYEGFKLRNQGQSLVSTAPESMRNGDFSAILGTTVIRDPKNGNTPFPDNIIPANRLDPIGQKLLNYWPLPNIPGAGLVNNYLALQNNTDNRDQFTQRVDFVESTKSTWFGRYSWENEGKFSPVLYLNGTQVTNDINQGMIANTRIFTPSLVNDFRFGYMGYDDSLLTQEANKENLMAQVGIPLLNPPPSGWGLTQIVITGFNTSSLGYIGDGLQGPFVNNDHTFQWMDSLAWTKGRHSIKFGAEIRRDQYNVQGNQTTRGQYFIAGDATGYGMSDFDLGYVNRTGITGLLAVSQLRSTGQYYFVTDSWKVRSNLTLEIGLRYEYTAPWNSKGDSMANVIIPQVTFTPDSTGPHPYFGRECSAYGQSSFYTPESIVRFNPAIQTQCVSGYDSTTLVNSDKNNFAPRLGLAWSPGRNWTIRTGFGVFFTQDETNHIFNESRNIAAPQVTVTENTSIHDLTFEHPLPASNNCGVPTPPYLCISTPVSFTSDPKGTTAYVEEYEFNVQHQLGPSTVLEVGYLGSQAHKLEAKLDYNNTVPGPGAVAPRTPWPEWGNLEEILAVAQSNYNAGSVKLTQRFSKGFTALAGYTYSKSLDDSPGVNPTNGNISALRLPQTGYCVRCEYGPSEFDANHRFVASVLYELPFGRGKQFLNHGIASAFLGGWQLNSIVTKSSGFPVSIVDGTNVSNSNASADRPNAVPGVNAKLANPTPNEWFNTQAFQLQPAYTYGNVGRDSIRGPGFFAWDFSTFKNFYFTERSFLQLRFECFNCANHPAFGDPGQTLTLDRTTAAGLPIPGTGTFGEITTTRPGIDMREIQFSLKFAF